jgi:hypothetical protein
MAESLKEVIEKLKQQKNSQASEVPVPLQAPVRKEIPHRVSNVAPVSLPPVEEYSEEEFEDNDGNDEDVSDEESVPVPLARKKVERKTEQLQTTEQTPAPIQEGELTEQQKEQIELEIELLQNDGRYREELLHQLSEMNKALVIIASVLVDIKPASE